MLNGKRVVWLTAIVCILAAALYGFWIEPNTVKVHHLYIRDATLHTLVGGHTVLHISDLHISSFGRREEKLLQLIDELKPDIIFLTGDYVQYNVSYAPALLFLSRLKARIGIWAVMGDYDYSNTRNSCLFCHTPGTGNPATIHTVRFLKNSAEKISLPDGVLSVGGLDYERTIDFSDDKLQPLIHNPPNILLSHTPLVFDFLDNEKPVLVLAGDTHGGQVSLPQWLWKFIGYTKCIRYIKGLFAVGRKTMYVNQGIGTSHVPLRFLTSPEVVVLHFI